MDRDEFVIKLLERVLKEFEQIQQRTNAWWSEKLHED